MSAPLGTGGVEGAEAERRQQLRAMKRRATGLLVAVTAVFVVLVVAGGDGTAADYARAAAEGAMVGGLADWFAVTAVFRHPLGLPIPHTAVVAARKDQFGATLGSFVQENFASGEVLAERVRSARVAERAGSWLGEPANAAVVARLAADGLVAVSDAMRDEDVNRFVDEELARVVDRVEVAPLLGRAVRLATADGRHAELLDVTLRAVERFLDDNRDELRARVAGTTPWWLPGAVEDAIFERLLAGARNLLHAVNTDPDHALRAQFDARLAHLVERLETDPAMAARGEELKRDLLAHPELRAWSAGVWGELKGALRAQSAEPGSPLRGRLAEGVAAVGRRLVDDPVARERAQRMAESAARHVAERYRAEIAEVVSGTVERWDAEETSDKLELLLGRDLQFIRINGTVVGGLAGLAIAVVAHVLG